MEIGFKEFYRGKKVLVTGHTGFKGSWLSIWLLDMGAKVVGVSLPPATRRDNFVLSGLKSRIEHYSQDIRDIDKLRKIFIDTQPDVVFHLAAQPLVLESYKNPLSTFQTNTLGTVNILEISRYFDNLKEIIIITTDKVYENKNWVWGYRENDRLGGYDPYSASKAAAEIVIDSYIKSYFDPVEYEQHGKVVASVRAGNVLGGGDWSENRIVPDFFRAIEAGEPLKIRNPSATRPWQHVLDPLGGYLILASKLCQNPSLFSGAWNFGPNSDNELTVSKLIDKFIVSTGKGKWIQERADSNPRESHLLKLDVSKSNRLLGFKSVITIDKMVNLTSDWYNRYSSVDVYNLCLEQIKIWTEKYIEIK